MAFQQLLYTSCEHGLAGYGGYQFNAATPGVPPDVLREVEERTVYEPPRWLQAEPAADEPEAYPIVLSYGLSDPASAAITAHVVFTGADYSGRPGNYFAHALVTSTPDLDFGSLLPVELWEAALWRTSTVDRTELPELAGPPPHGVIDRPGAQAFLDAQGSEELLPELLTAVGRAMTGDRPVLMAGHDATENAWWIAVVCYLLGENLGRRLTFTTYSHRPGYSRYHLVGVLPDTLPPDAAAAFQLFELAAGKTPGGGVHPLAAMLASTGVLAAPGLWQQASVFASGDETDLDDWLAPVAVAAGVLGRPLAPDVADAVAGWLPTTAAWMPPPLVDVGLGVALAQVPQALSDERLLGLLALARRLPGPARAEALERLLADRAITHLRRGEPVSPVPFSSPAAEIARYQAAGLLEAAAPATALAVLDWTAASGVMIPEAQLEHYGRTQLDPAAPPPEAARMLRAYPALLRGLIERLAAEPPQLTDGLLAGPIGALLNRDDLASHPALAELWLIRSMARGDRNPLRAFDEIVDLRAGAKRTPLVDETLLRRLWPGGCPAEQIAELLGALANPDPGPPAPDVLAWFETEIGAVPARGATTDSWLALAIALKDHQILPLLQEKATGPIRNTVRMLPLLDLAYRTGPDGGVDVFHRLFGEYAAADGDTRRLLRRELPVLLARTDRLDQALAGCPPEVAAPLGRKLRQRLAPLAPNIGLARRVYVAFTHWEAAGQPAVAGQLAIAFEEVSRWRRRDLIALGQAIADDGLAESFQAWRDGHRRVLTRKLLGGNPRPADDRL